MEHLLEQLRSLGYGVVFEYNPIEQLVYYQVYCEGELVDMGLADELNWEDKLKGICDECIICR